MTRIFVTLFLISAIPAYGYQARNGQTVTPRGAQDFVVEQRNGAAVRAYWCAAAEYAQRELGAGFSTRVYRASEPPRRRGEAIAFTLDPARRASASGLVVLNDDGGLSVNHGLFFCRLEARRDNGN